MDTAREMARSESIALAERVRTACIHAALQAYEDGGIQGLCGDGRWEYAVAAMKRLDVNALLLPDRPGDAGLRETTTADRR